MLNRLPRTRLNSGSLVGSNLAMNNPRLLPNHLPAELLTLVGKIAIQSAYVDMLLGELLGGLMDVKQDERAATVHELSTRRKTEKAETIIKSNINEPDRTELLSLVKRSGELLADRNLVLHAIIAYPGKELKDPLYVAFRGKHKKKDLPFSKDTLDPIFKDLDQISQELWGVCSKRGYIAPESSL